MATFLFNDRDNSDGRGEIASLTYQPDNWNEGEVYYESVARWDWNLRVGAFNAIERVHFGQDEFYGAWHKYAKNNSRRVNKAWGWVDISRLEQFHQFSENIATTIDINGEPHFVRFPVKRMFKAPDGRLFETQADDLKPVTVCFPGMFPYHRVFSEGGNRLVIKPELPDEKYGRYPGDVLHHRMQMLHDGKAICVPVTADKYFPDPGSDEFVWMDNVQRKAAWLKRNLEIDGYSYDAHRAAWLEDRINTASTFGYMQQAGIERAGKDYEANNELLQERREGKKSGEIVVLDGEEVDAAAVQPGHYSVHDRHGKLQRARVTVKGLAGAGVIRGVIALGHNLKTIDVFEV